MGPAKRRAVAISGNGLEAGSSGRSRYAVTTRSDCGAETTVRIAPEDAKTAQRFAAASEDPIPGQKEIRAAEGGQKRWAQALRRDQGDGEETEAIPFVKA